MAKKLFMAKTVLSRVLVLFLSTAFLLTCINTYIKTTDDFARSRILKLSNPGHGQCTGVQVWAPSGEAYTLTAGHCRNVVQNGKILAEDEDGTVWTLDFIAEDPSSDLMLLCAPTQIGADIGTSVSRHEHVHAITRGHGKPSFRTDGEILMEDLVTVPLFQIISFDDMMKCGGTKNQVEISLPYPVCLLQTFQTTATARIIPGSSGGPLFDRWGQVVGIASSFDETGLFSSFVTVNDINLFLKPY